jgi:hypothetical protein
MEARALGSPLAIVSFTFFVVLSAGLLLIGSLDPGPALLLTFIAGGAAAGFALWLVPLPASALAAAFGAASGFALAFAAAATSQDSDGAAAPVAGFAWGVAAFVAYSMFVALALSITAVWNRRRR